MTEAHQPGAPESRCAPPPPKRGKYEFKNMRAGDYIVLQFGSKIEANKARCAAFSNAHRLRSKIITRITSDFPGEYVVEVWRTE